MAIPTPEGLNAALWDVLAHGSTSAYADSVRRLVVRLSAAHVPVALADAYSAFATGAHTGSRVAPGLLSNDGIHPTPAGYALLARVFATVLEGRTLPVPA